jgi:hypothetical protein
VLNGSSDLRSIITATQINDVDLKLLISYLREYAQDRALKEYYAHALLAQELTEAARAELSTRVVDYRPNQDEIEEQARIRAKLEEEFAVIRQDYETETEIKRLTLQEKHEHEVRLFEKRWKTSMPHKYRKPSQKLLHLKQIEKQLAVTMEVTHAAYVHEQVRVKVDAESESAQRNLIRDYTNARLKLFERQRSEREQFERVRLDGLDLLEVDFRTRSDVQANHESAALLRFAHALNKPRPPCERPVTSQGVPKKRDVEFERLLPELRAPNDDCIVACERERRIRTREKNAEFQRRLEERDRGLYGALD